MSPASTGAGSPIRALPIFLAFFVMGRPRQVSVPGSNRTVPYDPQKRTAVGLSRLGTSRAVSLGAYAWALKKLDAARERAL